MLTIFVALSWGLRLLVLVCTTGNGGGGIRPTLQGLSSALLNGDDNDNDNNNSDNNNRSDNNNDNTCGGCERPRIIRGEEGK